MRMSLELRVMRHLLALDEHRNFARAARELGITQPALSRSIQTLEVSIGARLFDQPGRSFDDERSLQG